MSYSGLEVKNGGEAIAAFVDMVKGRITGDAAIRTSAALLEYCAQDTMAMVKLHETLINIV